MNANGKCSLIIRGGSIDNIEIERALNMKATTYYKKGQVNSKIIGENPQDVLVFENRFDGLLNIENSLMELIVKLKPSIGVLQEIKRLHEVYIRCQIASEFAQIDFQLSNCALREIHESGLDLRFSLLSWGGAE